MFIHDYIYCIRLPSYAHVIAKKTLVKLSNIGILKSLIKLLSSVSVQRHILLTVLLDIYR